VILKIFPPSLPQKNRNNENFFDFMKGFVNYLLGTSLSRLVQQRPFLCHDPHWHYVQHFSFFTLHPLFHKRGPRHFFQGLEGTAFSFSFFSFPILSFSFSFPFFSFPFLSFLFIRPTNVGNQPLLPTSLHFIFLSFVFLFRSFPFFFLSLFLGPPINE
jgi:hypothetical protein